MNYNNKITYILIIVEYVKYAKNDLSFVDNIYLFYLSILWFYKILSF